MKKWRIGKVGGPGNPFSWICRATPRLSGGRSEPARDLDVPGGGRLVHAGVVLPSQPALDVEAQPALVGRDRVDAVAQPVGAGLQRGRGRISAAAPRFHDDAVEGGPVPLVG